MNDLHRRPTRPVRACRRRLRLLAVLVASWLAAGASPALAQVQPAFLYSLSNFGGRLPYDWTRVSVDLERDETYVIYQNVIRVFNASGMEVFSFGDDLDVGVIADVAVDAQGDIILLSYRDTTPLLTRCTFRGVPIAPLEIRNVPESVAFRPNRMVFRRGRFYFASTATGTVVVTGPTGEFQEHIELLSLVDEEDERQRSGAELFGFSVDREGSIYFTIAVLFKAYRLSPDGTLASFGRPGSAPGRFGIAAGIVADSQGHVLVADRLRSVVLVFDKDLSFLTEFGTRGTRPENLVVPDELVIDGRDRVYVTQRLRRGVSVFALRAD